MGHHAAHYLHEACWSWQFEYAEEKPESASSSEKERVYRKDMAYIEFNTPCGFRHPKGEGGLGNTLHG